MINNQGYNTYGFFRHSTKTCKRLGHLLFTEDSKEYTSEAPLQAEALPKCVSYHELGLTTKESEPQNTELRLGCREDIAPNNY